MTTDILVIAGDHRQFLSLCEHAQQHWGKDKAFEITNVEELFGRQPGRVFIYGTYAKRRDWPLLKEWLVAHPDFRVLPIR